MCWLPALTAGIGIIVEGYGLLITGSMQISIFIILLIAITTACFSGLSGKMAWVRAWSSLAAFNVLVAVPWLFMGYSIQYDAKLAASYGSLAGPGGWGELAILLTKVMGYSFLGFAVLFFLLALWQYRRVKTGRLPK